MKTNYLILVLLASILFASPMAYSQETPPSPDPQQEIRMNFKDAQITDVLEYLSKTVGLVIVSDQLIDGRITVISEQPLNLDRAIALLNTIIAEKGYAAIRMNQTLKIVDIGNAKQMSIPVKTGSDPDAITAGDNVITQIIPIRYLDATKLQENLLPLLPEYADISANQASNSLIITDTTANIKRMVEIVKSLDTQMATIAEVQVFHLVYADAENTADLINEVFEQDSQQSSSEQRNPFSRMMGFMGRGGPGSSRGGSSDSQQSSGPDVKIRAAADTRTNVVVVSGPGDTLEVVASVIKELDSNPDEERSIFIYELKNARSDNLKEVLNNLFQQMQQINEQNTGGSTGGGGAMGRRTTTSSSSGSGSSSDFTDEVYIESDEDTNSLLIMTSSKNYEKIKKIIESLDQPVPQVLIKVLIAEITIGDSLDLGVEFSVLNMRDSGGMTITGTDFMADAITGGLITRTIEGDLDVTLRALEEVGQLNVLSRPYILTSNNQMAKITVGQLVPFIEDSRITETGQTINTITYEEIGINLEVTPYINTDGLVIMDVKPEISTTTAETVPISEEIDAAVFANRSAECRVAVLDGQTIVIGGLMEDQETEAVQKVPLLGDLPLLGGLFRRTIKENKKTELLIFLTPQVASGSDELKKISDNERENSNILQQIDLNPTLQQQIDNMESKPDKN